MLISSAQALDMLSAHAPRAWAKRVLSWQVYTGEMTLLFGRGKITEKLLGIAVLSGIGVRLGSKEEVSEAILKRVSEEYSDQTAEEIRQLGVHESVTVRTEEWESEWHEAPPLLLVRAEQLDWEAGTLTTTFFDDDQKLLRGYDDFMADFDHTLLEVELGLMGFELAAVEMLAPGGIAPTTEAFPSPLPPETGKDRKGGPGRRREYDWDGAFLHLIGQAEKNSIAPDPEAHGAQADIKRALADWFSAHGGKVPAESQLEACARRVLKSIKEARP